MININEEELQCKICYEFLYETVLCDKCSNAFCQECAINYKKKAKKYGRIDKCPICGTNNFTFQRCEEIDKLIKKRKQKPLQCQHCKRIIFDKEKYEQHIEECKYQCKFCLMMFDKEDDLLRHIKKNTEELFKALDLMNASRNIIKFNNENEKKIKKKKLVKKKTKDLHSERNEKKEEIKEETKEEKKEEIKEEKNEEKNEDDNIKEKSDSKKIIKKKIIKKKKIISKKKCGINYNTINYLNNNTFEGSLLKNEINQNKNDDENKLDEGMNKLNINEMDSNDKMIRNKNITEYLRKTSHNRKNNKKNDIPIKKIIKSHTQNNFHKNYLTDTKNTNNFEKEFIKEEKKNENIVKNKYMNLERNDQEFEKIFPNSEQKIFHLQPIEEEEKISRYNDYLNNPRPESIKPSTICGDAKLNTEYDLYFCGKPNHIDCICCTDHKCKPGACMCISCMKLNKKYHKLKSHYLINKSGRACKYSHGYFHCYCNYMHIVHDVGNNIFKPIYKCQGENICKPCEEITLLMETYLPNTICQKLRDRETKKAQF